MSGSNRPPRVDETPGDFQRWIREQAGDNADALSRAQRALSLAIQTELTPRQRTLLQMHYFEGLSQSDIACRCGVAPSTVSRTLRRCLTRLYRCVRYALM